MILLYTLTDTVEAQMRPHLGNLVQVPLHFEPCDSSVAYYMPIWICEENLRLGLGSSFNLPIPVPHSLQCIPKSIGLR